MGVRGHVAKDAFAEEGRASQADHGDHAVATGFPHCVSGRVHGCLAAAYGQLGRVIARHPWKLLIAGFGTYFLMLPGTLPMIMEGEEWLMWLKLDSQFINTFAFQGTEYYDDYKRGVSLFEPPREQAITMLPKGGTIMDVGFLKSVLQAEADLRSRKGEYDDVTYGLEDVCRKRNGVCEWQSLARMLTNGDAGVLDTLPSGATPAEIGEQLVAPVALPYRMSLKLMTSWGGEEFPDNPMDNAAMGRWLASRSALMTFLKLRKHGELSMHTRAYELQIEEFIEENRDGYGEIKQMSCLLELSFGREIARMCINALPLIFSTVGVMVLYACLFLGTQTRQPGESQRLLICMGAMIPAMASFASFGALGYFGLPFNVLAFMVPFLGIAMGIDNIFVTTSALKAVSPDKSIEDAIVEAVTNAGLAVTATSMSSLVALITSIFTSLNLPGFVSFNVAVSFTVFGNWVGALVLYPCMLTLNERRIAAGRRDILFWKQKAPASEATQEASRSFCAALLDPGPPLRRFIVETYAPLIEKSLPFKIVGTVFVLVCAIGGFALIGQIGSGMADTTMAPDSSYLVDFYDHNKEHFENAPPADVHIAIENMDLGSGDYMAKLKALFDKVSDDPDVVMIDCWPYEIAKMAAASPGRAAEAAVADFLTMSPAHEQDMDDWSGGDIRVGTPATALCHAMARLSWDAEKKADQADRLVALVKSGGVEATPFHMLFAVQVGRQRDIKDAILFTCAVATAAVFCTLLVFLPIHQAVIAITSMIGTVGALFGYMALADSHFSMVSFCSVVMAIGFCVDYATHVAHFADHHVERGTRWSARMKISVQSCGYDVGHGSFTAFLGVCLMMLGGSPAFRIFCLNVIVITVLGGSFALFGVPSVVSLISDAVCVFCETKVFPVDDSHEEVGASNRAEDQATKVLR